SFPSESSRLTSRVKRRAPGPSVWGSICESFPWLLTRTRKLTDMSQGSPSYPTPKNPGLIPDMSPLEHLFDQDVLPGEVCGVLARMFQVQQTEVAILRLDRGLLHFIFPDELRTAGSIPISSSSIAAHTAISKKSEIFNNFARVKHASIFETIKLGSTEG